MPKFSGHTIKAIVDQLIVPIHPLIKDSGIKQFDSGVTQLLADIVKRRFAKEFSACLTTAEQHMGKEKAKQYMGRVIRNAYKGTDDLATAVANSHIPPSTAALVVATTFRTSARKEARREMKESGILELIRNAKLLQERDKRKYSYWANGIERPNGPELEDLIVKNAVRFILEDSGIPFKDIHDEHVSKEAASGISIEVSEEEMKRAIIKGYDAVVESASRTSKEVDENLRLDFIQAMDEIGHYFGVKVQISGTDGELKIVADNTFYAKSKPKG